MYIDGDELARGYSTIVSNTEKDADMLHRDFKAEPIAIVGVGCRFSGSATNPEALWDMLSKGTTGWTKTASHRFNLNAFWHPNGDNKGTVGRTNNAISLVFGF